MAPLTADFPFFPLPLLQPVAYCSFVKLWDFQQLAEADSGEGSQYFFLQPLDQVHLGSGVRVRSLVWQTEGRWLISDEAGSLIQVLTFRLTPDSQ